MVQSTLGRPATSLNPQADILASQLKNRGADIAWWNPHLYDVFWVDSTNTYSGRDAATHGHSSEMPFLSWSYALSRATAKSIIYLMPGHTENASAAAAVTDCLPFAAANITTIGLGRGALMAKVSMDGATAECQIDQDGTSVFWVKFEAAAALVAKMIDITASNVELGLCKFTKTGASTQWLVGVDISGAVDNVKLHDLHFESTDDGADSCIRISAAATNPQIWNITGSGDFDDAFIHASTAPVNLRLFDCSCVQTEAAEECVNLAAATTGFVSRSRFKTTGGRNEYGECVVFDQFDAPGQLFAVRRAGAVLPANTTASLFTIAGAVKIRHIHGEITTVMSATATTMTLIFNPSDASASVNLAGATTVTSDAAGKMYTCVGVTATALSETTPATAVPADMLPAGGILCNSGTIDLLTNATNTGAVKWVIEYEALEPGAMISVA